MKQIDLSKLFKGTDRQCSFGPGQMPGVSTSSTLRLARLNCHRVASHVDDGTRRHSKLSWPRLLGQPTIFYRSLRFSTVRMQSN